MVTASPCSTVAAFQPVHASRNASSVSLLPGTSTVGVSITTSMSISLSRPMCIEANRRPPPPRRPRRPCPRARAPYGRRGGRR